MVRLGFSASYIALWALVVFQGLLILALLRQLAELRRLAAQGVPASEDGLPVGTPAPEFASFDFRSGRRISTRDLDGTGAVILFLSACAMCKRLADDLRDAATNGLPPIVAFCPGGERSCASIVKGLAPEVRLLFEDAEKTAASYRVASYPTAVVVDGKRRIRGWGHPESVQDLKQLLARSLASGSREVDPEGESLPAVSTLGVSQ